MDRTFASSLPSHFRYTPSHAPASPFFRTDDEPPVQSVTTQPPKTRLEVLTGWEVSFTVLCLYLSSILALVYILCSSVGINRYWNDTHTIPHLLPVESLLDSALQALSVTLPVFFALNLLLAPAVTDEQLWTLILLIVGLCATNPLTRADDASKEFHIIINDAVYTAAVYLYLFLAAHSYRVFHVQGVHATSFYLPKLAAAILYFLVKLVAGFRFGVSLGLIPYSRLLTLLLLQHSARSSLRIIIPVLLTTLLDTAFAIWLVREVTVTSDFLATVPYVENRAKQLGFRCFVYQTLVFCFNIISLSLITTYLLPRGYVNTLYDNSPKLVLLEPPIGRLALAFVYVTWTLVIAYVNLPPTPLLPFAQQLLTNARYHFRNNRVAGWLGFADIVSTEDAEDSDDGNELAPSSREVPTSTSIPLRYRHREAFDDVSVSPLEVRPVSPLVLSDGFAALHGISSFSAANRSDSFDRVDPEIVLEGLADISGNTGTQPIEIMQSTSDPRWRPWVSARNVTSPDMTDPVDALKRLRLRKNLFVMETAVTMVNASYLSYIPGNKREERIHPMERPKTQSLLHTGSLSADLDELARQIEEENDMLASPFRKTPTAEPEQPDFDDGTMFKVDPQEMAERHGFKLFRHLQNDMLNTHATVLVSSSRVIVAFSGTRDVTNWGVNANIKRTVLDEKLSRFEYELSRDRQNGQDDEDNFVNNNYDELSLETFDFLKLEGNARRNFGKSMETSQLRRSKSEERLLDEMEGGQLSPFASTGRRDSGVTRYGTVETSPRGRYHSMYSERDEHGVSRTGQGVTMVASAIAKELLTFGQPKVHEGFIEAYMSLRKQVMGTLIELYRGKEVRSRKSSLTGGIAKSLPLFFCGHSLGGALATFASYEAARYYKRIGISRRQDISCTTFGCPRIGNEAFKARYERLVETHWRFEIAADPIPQMPYLFLNYVPVGVQILIDQSGMLLIDPSFIEVQWWGKLSNLYMGYRLHVRASYCMALKTHCKLYKNGTDDLADVFWPFPIKVQTKGLFRHAQQ